jgi:hypothetical protein
MRDPDTIIEACARAAHEANRSYSRALGDFSHTSWENATEEQRASCRNGVEGIFNGNDARKSHESWLRFKVAAGWAYGPVKDEAKKQHPCFLPYDQLPEAQRLKDTIFHDVVKTMATALGKVIVKEG